MKITSMSQQNKLVSHLKMFLLATFTAVVFPRPSKAWLRRAQGSALPQGRFGVGTEPSAPLDTREGQCWGWSSCLRCWVIHQELLCTSPGLQLIQTPGTDHAQPLAHPLGPTHKQGQLWQSKLWVPGVHISGILHSGCG